MLNINGSNASKKKTPLENRTVNEVSDSQFNKIAIIINLKF